MPPPPSPSPSPTKTPAQSEFAPGAADGTSARAMHCGPRLDVPSLAGSCKVESNYPSSLLSKPLPIGIGAQWGLLVEWRRLRATTSFSLTSRSCSMARNHGRGGIEFLKKERPVAVAQTGSIKPNGSSRKEAARSALQSEPASLPKLAYFVS